MPRLILFNKPFNVLSQFTDASGRATLGDFIDQPGVYPAGRLDRDSEGLLLLTDCGRLQAAISQPAFKMPKTYLVQVEGAIDAEALAALARGVELRDGPTLPARAEALSEPALWPRDPPVRYRRHIPDSWLQLTISEGRNRQVRRMTAATGFPTLRLVRQAIGPWQLGSLAPGEYRVIDLDEQALAAVPGYNATPPVRAAADKRSHRHNRGKRGNRQSTGPGRPSGRRRGQSG